VPVQLLTEGMDAVARPGTMGAVTILRKEWCVLTDGDDSGGAQPQALDLCLSPQLTQAGVSQLNGGGRL
jgi:hypothetical protein